MEQLPSEKRDPVHPDTAEMDYLDMLLLEVCMIRTSDCKFNKTKYFVLRCFDEVMKYALRIMK